jgi:putative transposase
MKKKYTGSFKAQIVQEILKEERTIVQIASEHGIHPQQLTDWKAVVLKGMPSLFGEDRKTATAIKASYEQRLQELYAEIGRLTTQVSWLKKKSGIQSE